MAKKKSTVKEEDARANVPAGNSSGASVFSIFSDENPFKRKPDELNATSEVKSGDDAPQKKMINTRERSSPGGFEGAEGVKTASGVIPAEKTPKKKRKRDEAEKKIIDGRTGNAGAGAVAVGAKRKNADREDGEVLISSNLGDEGFDSEEKLQRTIFIGNLPLKVKKKTMLKEFARFGEIESVRIRSIPLVDTKVPRKGAVMLKKINDAADNVHAYVVFKVKDSAESALSHNMAVVGGHHIRVDRACPPRKKLKSEAAPLYDIKRTVFLGNLPFDVKDEEIYQLFSGIKELENSVEGVRVVRDPHGGVGKGFAYLLLKTMEAAKIAAKQRRLQIRGRELRIFPAKQESTSLKRKSSLLPEKENISERKRRRSPPPMVQPSRVRGAMSYQGVRANKESGKRKTPAGKGTGKGNSATPPVVRKGRVSIGSHERKRKLDTQTPENGSKLHKRMKK